MAKYFLFKILIFILFLFSCNVFSSEESGVCFSLADYLEMKSSLKEWGSLKRGNLEQVSQKSYKDFELAFENFKKEFAKKILEIDVFKKKV